MIWDKIRSYLPTKSSSVSDRSVREWQESFIASPYHEWMRENKHVTRCIELFLQSIPKPELPRLIAMKQELVFIPTNAHYSFSLKGNEKLNIVVIFPELLKLLKSAAYHQGLAILAHELGHFICDHFNSNKLPLEAQVEADNFALSMGYGEELLALIEKENFSIEQKVRISNLTCKIIPSKYREKYRELN